MQFVYREEGEDTLYSSNYSNFNNYYTLIDVENPFQNYFLQIESNQEEEGDKFFSERTVVTPEGRTYLMLTSGWNTVNRTLMDLTDTLIMKQNPVKSSYFLDLCVVEKLFKNGTRTLDHFRIPWTDYSEPKDSRTARTLNDRLWACDPKTHMQSVKFETRIPSSQLFSFLANLSTETTADELDDFLENQDFSAVV